MADPIKVKLLDAQKNPILPETSADQVKTTDGSNVETKLKTLESAVSGKVPCHIVEDIPARDGLESPKQGDLCWVKDASADESVNSGAAQYIYDGSAWVKIAEAESMDLVVNWADIQGKEAVETAMSKAHDHANAEILNGISASGDTMTVNGKTYYSGRMVAIIENGAEIPADMNPNGIVVNENTNGIVTVNGHSYEDKSLQTENTNFALLVAKHFSEPFKDSNGYGESIARLSNMLGGGVMVQRFGDLIRGQRSTPKRIEKGFMTPTLAATPGDLSLVMPKRILDGIIEMIYALDKIAPGTANDDTLLYGVEVKFYNMEVALDEHLETAHRGLYVIGDGSGITHSLSHASASGVFVARDILAQNAG